MRPFLEAVRPMVSILIAMVLCLVWALASPNQVLQRNTRIFFYVTGTLCANLSCRLIVAQMSSTRCELINMFIYPLFGAVCSSLLIPGLPKEAEMFMLYLLAVGFTLFHLHYGVCVVHQMASHLRIDAFSIKDHGDVRLLSSNADTADNNIINASDDDELEQIDINEMEVQVVINAAVDDRNGLNANKSKSSSTLHV